MISEVNEEDEMSVLSTERIFETQESIPRELQADYSLRNTQITESELRRLKNSSEYRKIGLKLSPEVEEVETREFQHLELIANYSEYSETKHRNSLANSEVKKRLLDLHENLKSQIE